jgi:hypothetical protein
MRLMLAVAVAFVVFASQAMAQVLPPKPYDPAVARVAGRAELYLAPDQARVSVGFYNPGRTPQEASDAVARRARALEQALQSLDRTKVALERTDIGVRPVMQPGGDRRPDRVRGYEANASMTVLVRDLDLLSRVVEAGVNAQPDTFNDVAFSIADTNAARRKAREAAIKDAVDKARVYVEGAGFRLGRLLEVQEGGSNMIAQSGNRAMMRAAPTLMSEDGAAATPPPIAAEPQLYTAEVSVVFEITGAPPVR